MESNPVKTKSKADPDGHLVYSVTPPQTRGTQHFILQHSGVPAVSSAKECAAKRQQVIFLPNIFLHRMPFLLKSPVKAVVSVNS